MIGAVVVTYYPNLTYFAQVVSATLSQVDQLVIVNNGDDALDCSCIPQESEVMVINNGENLGVGAAINIGVRKLLSCGCDYFLLLDQDSQLKMGAVDQLYSSFNNYANGEVAAIGPAYYDISLDEVSPFLKRGKDGVDWIYGDKGSLVECDFIITSGTLTSANVLQDVGLMNEGFFIDHIDHEWCLRAASKGYKILGDSSITLLHSIGGEPFRFKGRLQHSHAPVRYYYLFRNTILLYKKDYVPKFWKRFFVKHILYSFLMHGFGFFSKKKLRKLMFMYKGVVDGLRNKTGPYLAG